MWSLSLAMSEWAWSGSREQFLHCGLRKFRYSKSSVDRWYVYTTQRRRIVYVTWDNGSRLDRVIVECTLSITHCLRLNLQLHTIDLVRTCRISSFFTVAWQLARFQLTRRIARSLGASWASCYPLSSVLLLWLTNFSRHEIACADVPLISCPLVYAELIEWSLRLCAHVRSFDVKYVLSLWVISY